MASVTMPIPHTSEGLFIAAQKDRKSNSHAFSNKTPERKATSGKQSRLHWITVHPTPYNALLFRHLDAESTIDLNVHYLRAVVSTRPWQSPVATGYNWRLLAPRFGLDGHLVNTILSEPDSFFVVEGGWTMVPLNALINILAARGSRFAVYTDTPNETKARSRLKQTARSQWLRFIFRRAAFVMGTGQVSRDPLLRLGCEEAKFVNFPFWTDVTAFTPEAQTGAHTPDLIRFLSVGRLNNRHKGYDLALTALSRVMSRHPSKRFHYTFVGSGEDEAALRAMAHELDLTAHVEFLGWLEPGDLPALFANNDVLLHPARVEPFGVAVLEAMASGKVVIGSDATGAVRDRVVHGVNGLSFPSGDVNALADCIDWCVAHESQLPEIGRKARQTAEEWPIERAVATVIQMLNHC